MKFSTIEIDKKTVFVDNDYTANNSKTNKDRSNEGEKINIKGLNKIDIATRLYMNINQNRFVSPLELIEFLFWFKGSSYKLDNFKLYNLKIDLSEDFFDPTQYDQFNDTYTNKERWTAFQCIEELRKEIEYSRIVKSEVANGLQKFLNRKDFKLSVDTDSFKLYFSSELPFEQLVEVAEALKKINLHSYAKTSNTYQTPQKPACVEIRDPYQMILQHIKQDIEEVKKIEAPTAKK